jgi:hypothetical protein
MDLDLLDGFSDIIAQCKKVGKLVTIMNIGGVRTVAKIKP